MLTPPNMLNSPQVSIVISFVVKYVGTLKKMASHPSYKSDFSIRFSIFYKYKMTSASYSSFENWIWHMIL
jgi:hypothetical protein